MESIKPNKFIVFVLGLLPPFGFLYLRKPVVAATYFVGLNIFYLLAQFFGFDSRYFYVALPVSVLHSFYVLSTVDDFSIRPWYSTWQGLVPLFLIVPFCRWFVLEPFHIPSGAMIPTLLVGDLILVNKYHYGLRLPVINTKITEGNKPQRGDVMVFRYPPQPSLDYIKRVVGVPGDTVAYRNKRLTVNGQVVETNALPDFLDEDSMRYFKQFEEKLGEKPHRLLNDDNRPAFVQVQPNFFGAEGCNYTVEGVTCKVPDGHYFMMGDNRDNSLDSRYWGFVPDANIVGRAFFVWMNFSSLKRIGGFN